MGGEQEKEKSEEKPKELTKDEKKGETSTSTYLSQPENPMSGFANRAYSPIVEDPNERDEKGSKRLDDDLSVSEQSRAASPSSRSRTPQPTTASPKRATSPKTEQSETTSPIAGVSAKENAGTKDESSVKVVSKSSEKTTSNQPIFKPLVTEKGKSKTTGKNIGGWI